MGDFLAKEFPMTDADFARVKHIAYRLTGITLSNHKKNMVYSRLSRRIRHLNMSCFADYIALVEEGRQDENTEFVNAITTNLTSFFREIHHFYFLKSNLIPHLIKEKAKHKRLRIWSAGCSTGEEPYSIAMVLKSFAALSTWDIKILATDLDSNVIEKARQGSYTAERAEGIPGEYRRFLQVDRAHEYIKVKDSARDIITFKCLNLLNDWPMKGPFDIIFCRNVVIYFNADTQRVLFDRYADMLTAKGNLFIGHSESLHSITTRFKPLGRTIYERCQ